MKDENTLYWIWLSQKCGIASRQFDRLIEKYDDPFDLYRLDGDEIEQLEGINDALKAKLGEKDLDAAYSTLRYCKENKVDIVSYGDSRYPSRLKNIEDAPILLYCLGHFPDFNSSLCIGVVGTRKMSEYGKQSAYKISYELASAGVVIVSGMALGVDGTAACGALSAGGRTVAVLGCGISHVYPKEHKKLMGEIARHGAVITEYPPEEPPHGHNFPKRNRIISGLCQGILVVEGAVGSGALITARRAIDQGREVFALPGKIDESNSEGPNELIREGAYTALCSDDILGRYEFLYGDVIDSSRLAKAKRKLSRADADHALAKYGVGTRSVGRKKSADADAPKSLREDEDIRAELLESRDGSGSVKAEKPKGARAEERHEKSDEKIAKTESLADDSAALLDTLDESTRRVFENLPIDKAVSIDALAALGINTGEAVTALTMLELCGLVSALPGGLYVRK